MRRTHFPFQRLLVGELAAIDAVACCRFAETGDRHELPQEHGVGDLEIPFFVDFVDGEEAFMGDGLVGDHLFIGLWSLFWKGEAGKRHAGFGSIGQGHRVVSSLSQCGSNRYYGQSRHQYGILHCCRWIVNRLSF